MILYQDEGTNWRQCPSLADAVELVLDTNHARSAARFVSVVGAGGKSSVCRRLVREWSDRGLRSILTTTTHIVKEETMPFFREGSDVADYFAAHSGPVEVGVEQQVSPTKWKIKGLPETELPFLQTVSDRIACEADGAHCQPAKFPNWHEPVYSPLTDLSIVVWGLSALGKSLTETCHRATLAARYLCCSEEAELDVAKSVRLIRGGYLNRDTETEVFHEGKSNPYWATLTPPVNCPWIVILNQADDVKRLMLAKKMASALAPTPVLITRLVVL
ncbi:MAG TPA: putative selenium-dependent hydroxylase accessory protein YqeC [Clostridiaceae bacterium]|nr:putative selenium-dependent hydroxylase accessory protein YqeC [Clostridiaceae bacterium]